MSENVFPQETSYARIFSEMGSIEASFLDTGDLRSGTESLRALEQSIQKLTAPTNQSYLLVREHLLARVYLLLGYMHSANAEYSKNEEAYKARAAQYFEEAIEYAENSQAQPFLSESYRIQGDAWMQLGSVNSFPFLVMHNEKFRDFPLKALEKDPNNLHAHLSRALYLLNAPEIVGGSIEKSAQLLAELSEQARGVLQFHSLSWLGLAYQKLGKSKAARTAWLRAREIIPQNRWIRDRLSNN